MIAMQRSQWKTHFSSRFLISLMWLLLGGLFLLALFLLSVGTSTAQPDSTAPPYHYQKEITEKAIWHRVTLPKKEMDERWVLRPWIASPLKDVRAIARESAASLVINAGFFDPQNGLASSYVILEQRLLGRPEDNPRMKDNPGLQPYWAKILNRSEFRMYECTLSNRTVETRYDIQRHQAPAPKGCVLISSVGAGPGVYPDLLTLEEGFFALKNGKTIRDPIGVHTPNARTAVGLMPNGDVVLVMVEQEGSGKQFSKRGASTIDLAQYFFKLGAIKAMALDGGSSSSLVMGKTVLWGKKSVDNTPVKRPVQSALVLLAQ